MSGDTQRASDDGSIPGGLLYVIRFLTLLAMAVSAYLAWVSFSGGAVVGCGPDSGCDKVLQSRWAYWFGAPVSLLALAVYSLILGASCFLGRGASAAAQSKAWSWLVPSALLVAGAAVWFVGLQTFAVHGFCPYCLVAHGSGFLAAFLLLHTSCHVGIGMAPHPTLSPRCGTGNVNRAGRGIKGEGPCFFHRLRKSLHRVRSCVLIGAPPGQQPEKTSELQTQVFLPTRGLKKGAILALTGLAALVLGQVVHQPRTYQVKSIHGDTSVGKSGGGAEPAAQPTPALAQARRPTNAASSPVLQVAPGTSPPMAAPRMFPVYDGRVTLNLAETPVIGAPTNQYVAVSLFDYTCHHCRLMHPLLAEAQRTWSNHLAIVSLPMPLDPGCNPTVLRAHPLHINACEYARLGLTVWRAARAKHREFDDWLFSGDKPPPLPVAQAYAAQLVGTNAFVQARQDPWIEQQLKLDVAIYELAYRAGQGQMPQLILGRSVALGTYSREDLMKLLVEHLGLKAGP